MNENISEIQRLLQEIAGHLQSGTKTDTRKAGVAAELGLRDGRHPTPIPFSLCAIRSLSMAACGAGVPAVGSNVLTQRTRQW